MDSYVRIARLENEVEAALLDSTLTDRGIDHAMIDLHSSVFNGVLEPGEGWGYIDGPVEARETILQTLNELRAQAASPEESVGE